MNKDPYRYFRIEARELVESLAEEVSRLKVGLPRPEIVAGLLRLAHTLKGAARVVRQLELAELAHEMEEVLSGIRERAGAAEAEDLARLAGLVDRLIAGLSRLAPSVLPPAAAPRAAPEPASRALAAELPFETVRVEVEEVDGILAGVGEAGVQLALLRREVERLKALTTLSTALAAHASGGDHAGPLAAVRGLATELHARLERTSASLEAGIERVEQELGDVRDGSEHLRLVPARALLGTLKGAARDAAATLGKSVEVSLSGGSLRLDGHVLAPLRDALLHLVRNAVAHGIETPNERRAAGKPPAGAIRLAFTRLGTRVRLTCEDDGKGIDVEAVRQRLLARGLADPAELSALDRDQVLARLLSAGVSTTAETNQISGRGVGLDAVRAAVRQLQGEVALASESGRGTTVTLTVPVSLAAVRALVVEVGARTAAIPLDAVEQALRVEERHVRRSPAGDTIAHGGQVIPFLPLDRALRQSRQSAPRAAWPAVIVSAGTRRAAVAVDRLRGASEVVIRPLPPAVPVDPIVAGAFLDAEGNAELVLDAAGLLAAVEGSAGSTAPEAEPVRSPVLVIDDSLTTRMLEQSILESAGYEVELAVSAEQGLEKARQREFGVFIVDVEMPGLSGFEFVELTRADPKLGRVPAILVSSRASNEDRQRGEAAGASAYVVKGDFDQNVLLGTIRRLLG